MTATTLLIYDIPSDRLRAKVANACLDYGLERIQYSAFQGPLTHNRQEELLQRIRRIIGPHAANIQLMPLCERDLRCTVRWLQQEPPLRAEIEQRDKDNEKKGSGRKGAVE